MRIRCIISICKIGNHYIFPYLCNHYAYHPHRIHLLCGPAAVQPIHGSPCRQRHFLPGQPQVALVYGSLRNGGSQHIRHHVCVGAGHGLEDRHDLSPNVPGLHIGLFCCCLFVASVVFSAPPHRHLGLARRPTGAQVL